MGAQILIVEDEPTIASLVRTYLERDGHDVTSVGDGAAALDRLRDDPPELVVLDLGLPDLDGLRVAHAAPPQTRVVVLTARSEEPERMKGFAAGVDDYVAKPFSPRELAARVTAVLRRAAPEGASEEDAELTAGPLRLRPALREADVDGRDLALTEREFALVHDLVVNAGRVVSREALLERAWGFRSPGQTRTVDQHVAQVRAKLGDDAGLLRTIRGLGYRIDR